jgi:8-oxo-dGTP diphosphatase
VTRGKDEHMRTTVNFAADVVLFAADQRTGDWHVLLIERGREPFAGCWALPGGHVEVRPARLLAVLDRPGVDVAA